MKVPPGACDCHVHVFGPAARFPFATDRTYTPPDASIEELHALQKRLGFERVVIVQPSVYGTDNSCTLDALKQSRSRARGVAVIDEKTSLAGPRLIEEAAQRVASLGWHVQTFTNVGVIRELNFEAISVPLVIDHFGLPRDRDDCEYLAHLLDTRNVYVKLSGPHRLPVDPGPVVRTLVAANPERCLWGSDWPHPVSGARDPEKVQPFDAIDDAAALERLHGWVGDATLFRKILVDNPARLYDF